MPGKPVFGRASEEAEEEAGEGRGGGAGGAIQSELGPVPDGVTNLGERAGLNACLLQLFLPVRSCDPLAVCISRVRS